MMEEIKDNIMHGFAIQLHTEIWQEGEMYIAYVPPLDLSSCGRTVEEAKKNIREAAEAFLEEVQGAGALKEVLEEAGFAFRQERWRSPEPIAFEKMNLAF